MPDTDSDAAKAAAASAAATAASAAKTAKVRSLYDATRASASGFKAAQTRMIKKADVLLAAASTRPTSRGQLAELQDHLVRIRQSYARMEAVYDKLVDLDPANAMDYEAAISHEDHKYTKCCELLVDATARMEADLNKPPTPLSSAPREGPGFEPNPKVVSTLKPHLVLGTSHSSIQLFNWAEQFEQYYTSSKFGRASILEQHGYFRSCMDAALYERLRRKITTDMPIFGPDSCMALLNAEFLRLHPLFSRRMAFFRSVQPASQLFSEWGNTLELLAAEAQLDKMDVDDMISMRYIIGGTDQKLLDEMLRLKDPSLDDLKVVVDHYEMNILNKSNISGGSSAEVRSTSNKKDKKKKGAYEKEVSTATSREERIAELKAKSRCLRCGKPWAKDHDCPAAKGGKCKKCGSAGHWAPVCLDGFKDTRTDVLAIEHEADPSIYAETRVVLSTASSFGKPTPRMGIVMHYNPQFHFSALPDSGATGSILALDVARKHGVDVKPGGPSCYHGGKRG